MLLLGIDPGHGGTNTGTIHGEGANKLVEKDYTLELGRLLYHSIITDMAIHTKVKPFLLRTEDETISYSRRAAQAQELGCQLVLNLHVNAHIDSDLRGLMAFHWPGSHTAATGAQALDAACPKALRRTRNSVFAVGEAEWLRAARSIISKYHCPSILVELGFATNPQDRSYLLSTLGKLRLVQALKVGVLAYLEDTQYV